MPKLPNKEFRAMVPLLREKGFYEHEEPRPINWSAYNTTEIDNAYETLVFIRESVDEAAYLQTHGKVGKPLTDPKVLAKAVLASEALGLTERNAQGWLKIIGPLLSINQHLDDRTIGDAYDKIEVIYILKQVFDRTKQSDGVLCGDGTGLETSRKQNYESYKTANGYMTSIIDSREIVQAFDISGEQECRAMHKLVEEVEGNSLRLDAGFVDRRLTDRISAKGMIPYIFPKSDLNLNGRLAWKQMYLELYYDAIQWLTEYHQRSHSESFHSSFKVRNKPIMKRRPMCQLSQVTARIILHNRRRLYYFSKLANAS
jgi:transposase|tara:strand:- start:153 stop:1094 length:942 start_codon:yes stop_codon:yes gene_type:complete